MIHIHTIRLDNESLANKEHLCQTLVPFTKQFEVLNSINLGVLCDLELSNYEHTDGMIYIISSKSSKKFEELDSDDIECYIRMHPVYPAILSYPLPESAIPSLVATLVSLSLPLTKVQGITPSPQLFCDCYKLEMQKLHPSKSYLIHPEMNQAIYMCSREEFAAHGTQPNYDAGSYSVATSEDEDLLVDWHTNFLRELAQDDDIPALKGQLQRGIQAKSIYIWRDKGTPIGTMGLVKVSDNCARINRSYIPPHLRRNPLRTYCGIYYFCQIVFKDYEFATSLMNVANKPAITVIEKVGFKLCKNWDLLAFVEEKN